MEQNIKDVKKEMYLMMHKAQEIILLAEEGYMKNKLSSLNEAEELVGEVVSKEEAVTAALAKMASTDKEARMLLGVPSHIATITLNIKRIMAGSRIRITDGLLFSEKADKEAFALFSTAKDAIKKAGEATITSAKNTIAGVVAESESLERMTNDFATAHEERLVTGECQPKASSTYLNVLYAFENLGAHLKDVVTRLEIKQ